LSKILEGWKDYFSELYSTNNSATFELEKLELVKLQNEILENSEKDGTPIEMATLCPSMISCFRCSGPFFGE
jgi:hypothetical protein